MLRINQEVWTPPRNIDGPSIVPLRVLVDLMEEANSSAPMSYQVTHSPSYGSMLAGETIAVSGWWDLKRRTRQSFRPRNKHDGHGTLPSCCAVHNVREGVISGCLPSASQLGTPCPFMIDQSHGEATYLQSEPNLSLQKTSSNASAQFPPLLLAWVTAPCSDGALPFLPPSMELGHFHWAAPGRPSPRGAWE